VRALTVMIPECVIEKLTAVVAIEALPGEGRLTFRGV